MKARVLLVMGVSGSGKTTIGRALAAALGWWFADADAYHPAANREKMNRGQPLSDTDREPWLLELRRLIEQHLSEHQPLVLACSALKERYRAILSDQLEGVQIVFLHGSPQLIAERMRQREHFMPLSLLDSQLSALEPPTQAIRADIAPPVEAIVQQVLLELETEMGV